MIANPSTIKRSLKTKIKSYGDETKDFHNRETPKVESNYTSSAVILINFVLEKDKNYYTQVIFKEHKYIEKAKKVAKYITGAKNFLLMIVISLINDKSNKAL